MSDKSPAERLALTKKRSRKPRYTNKRKPGPVVCRLREMRDALDLSLYDIAGAVEMSVAGLHAIEHGGNCEMTTALKLSEFFGKRIDEIWSAK
jgi:DNA-binding XRE family transcriptional regulator